MGDVSDHNLSPLQGLCLAGFFLSHPGINCFKEVPTDSLEVAPINCGFVVVESKKPR